MNPTTELRGEISRLAEENALLRGALTGCLHRMA